MYKQKERQRRSLKRIFFHGLILDHSGFMCPVESNYFASVDTARANRLTFGIELEQALP